MATTSPDSISYPTNSSSKQTIEDHLEDTATSIQNALNTKASLSGATFTNTVNTTGFSSRTTEGVTTFSVGKSDNAGQVEIGRQDGIAANPYIDFHSGSVATDYDSRIQATGGSGVDGGGSLNINASVVSFSSRISLQNHPYFLAYSSGGGTVTYNSNQVIRFDVVRRQVGSSYNASNYRFTAPVSGNYFLWFTAFNVGGTLRVSIRLNGGSGVFGQGGSANSIDYHQAGVTYMAAGDYADVRPAYDNTSLFLSDNHTEFGGLLLG